MTINVTGLEISEKELAEYQKRGQEKYGEELESMDIRVDEDSVDITYHLTYQPFERVRRITGYLVGTMDRWNNAKQAEERDRVKHDVGD